MTRAEPAGLMAFWADIDPDYEMRFLEWHNCEHMPERVSVPGFCEGRRYRGIDNDMNDSGAPFAHVIQDAFRIDYALPAA